MSLRGADTLMPAKRRSRREIAADHDQRLIQPKSTSRINETATETRSELKQPMRLENKKNTDHLPA
jgi:hypothetical protein